MWTYNDDMLSQTQTNRSNLAMTETSTPEQQPCHSRDDIETSIKEFSRLWPSSTDTVHSNKSNQYNDSRNSSIASSHNINSEFSGNYSKRNGALVSGGIPLAPLTLETDPNAWELSSPTIEINQNRK